MTYSRAAISPRPALVCLAIAALMLIALAAFTAKATAPSRDAVLAAVRVFSRIDSTERKIAVCRTTDPTNAEQYDRAFVAYQLSVGPVLARVYVLLRTEAERFGVPQDQFVQQATDASDIAAREVKRLQTVNPEAFLQQCHNIANEADHLTEAFGSLRDQMPDDMRLIDAWH